MTAAIRAATTQSPHGRRTQRSDRGREHKPIERSAAVRAVLFRFDERLVQAGPLAAEQVVWVW